MDMEYQDGQSLAVEDDVWEDGNQQPQMPQTPVRFTTPQRRPPATPVSNFAISTSPISSGSGSPSSDVERDNNLEAGEIAQNTSIIEGAVGEDIDEDGSLSDENPIRSLFGSRDTIRSSILRRRRQQLEGRTDEDENQGMSDAVMSAVWANGKIGIAYYQLDTSELFVLPDTAESAPDYTVLKSLFRQVMPRHLILNSRQDERMLKVAQELCGENITADPEGDESEVGQRQEPEIDPDGSQLYLVQGKYFAPDTCKQRVLSLKIPYERKDSSPDEHDLFISSLIPFRSETMIRAAGGLLKFLDKSAIEIFQIDLIDAQVPVLDIKLCTMNDMVLVDDTAWQSLQIFSLDIHPSTVKQGSNSGSKEGLSVFGMLNRCSTLQGARSLRLMLLRPCRNIPTLERRYDVIDFCINTRNLEFVKSATDCLKSVKSLPKLLYKLSLLHAKVSEWKDLYQTVYHCLLLGEMCSCQPQSIELFSELSNSDNLNVLKGLSQEMMRVIDFDESNLADRIVARHGIDPLLDTKKQQYACLPEIMALVAREEMQNLPGYVQQCCVVYIPEVGYLLAASLWQENLSLEEIEIEGLEFKFKTNELAYYKSPRTKELDVVLGDCSVAILEKETSIMICLTECIIGQSALLLKIGCLVSELDCLISMSTISKNNGFVRPEIVPGDEKLEIIDGRHPLVEMICDFVPNSTTFSGQEKIAILTGPNASGKSIYLKQIGVIVIMALSGSFVPAKFARIPTFDRICTRIHATESLSTGFSSFMIDLSQISLALRTSTQQSLVIIDEFGKGTAEADGLALLVASIEDFTNRRVNSPTIFLSTHFYSLMNYLGVSNVVKMQSMKFLQRDDPIPQITYLFELTDGVCESSFARLVAENNGIPRELVERSSMIENIVKQQLGEECLVPAKTLSQIDREESMVELAKQFLSLDIEETDPKEYLSFLKGWISEHDGSSK